MDLKTARDYRRQFQALLPWGAAWTRTLGTVLTRALSAFAEEFARIDARVHALMDEADPNTTTELLAEWERVAGLPDNCSGVLSATIQGRRLDLVSKLSATGGQTPAYYIEVARALGFDITIQELRPFRAGQGSAGDPAYDDPWHHVWRVIAPATTITYFRAGESTAGEPLAWWGNSALECRINQLKPAHTRVEFSYPPELSVLLTVDGTPWQWPSGENIQLNS